MLNIYYKITEIPPENGSHRWHISFRRLTCAGFTKNGLPADLRIGQIYKIAASSFLQTPIPPPHEVIARHANTAFQTRRIDRLINIDSAAGIVIRGNRPWDEEQPALEDSDPQVEALSTEGAAILGASSHHLASSEAPT